MIEQNNANHRIVSNLGLYEVVDDVARTHDKVAWDQWGEYTSLNPPYDHPGHPANTGRLASSPTPHEGCDRAYAS